MDDQWTLSRWRTFLESGFMDGWMDGWIDGWMDKGMDEQTGQI